MINAEKFKDELKSLNDADKLWCSGFDEYNMTFDGCINMKCENCAFNVGKGCNNARYNWLLSEYKKPIILIELEYDILKFIADNTSNMYITRTKVGNIYLHKSKPKKDKVNGLWISEYPTSLIPFNKLFKFITWEDKEPYSINDILKNCRVIDESVIIHKIVDE